MSIPGIEERLNWRVEEETRKIEAAISKIMLETDSYRTVLYAIARSSLTGSDCARLAIDVLGRFGHGK